MSTQDEQSKMSLTTRRALAGAILGGSFGVIGGAKAGQRSPALSLQELGDHLAIEQLVYRYGESVDNLDATALDDCFAPGGVMSIGDSFKFEARFAEKLFASVLSKFVCTMHNVQSHVYTINKDVASGWTYCVASHVSTAGPDHVKQDHYIRYNDELIRQNGEWKFLKRKLELLFMTSVSVTMIAPPQSRSKKPS